MPCLTNVDDALLAANWPLRPAMPPAIARVQGLFSKCSDGTRSFSAGGDGFFYQLIYDSAGHLSFAYTLTAPPTGDAGCTKLVCGVAPQEASLPCNGCEMRSDSPPKGTQVCHDGQSNGPVFACEIDENGRWVFPCLGTN